MPTSINGLGLVLQLSSIEVNEVELQYYKHPVPRGGAVFLFFLKENPLC